MSMMMIIMMMMVTMAIIFDGDDDHGYDEIGMKQIAPLVATNKQTSR
jgi:hypothetical protein